MRKSDRWKYLSTRVFILLSAVLCFLTLQTLIQCILFFREEAPFFQVALFALFTALCFGAFWFLVVRPYRRIQMTMERILEGYILPDSRLFERALLTPTMETEIRRLEQMLKSPEMMDLNKRQAQYLALQNQINPHFLYNALEAIRTDALLADCGDIAETTEALATFFRYTISNVQEYVTFSDELDNAENYFTIQRCRFGDKISMKLDMENEKLLEARMPKLILQPLVENAVSHGLEGKLGYGTVRIVVENSDRTLFLRVRDDGVGIPDEQVERLNRQFSENAGPAAEQQRGGIALRNVNSRIRLVFGEDYGLRVFSAEGVGTECCVTLPLLFQEE